MYIAKRNKRVIKLQETTGEKFDLSIIIVNWNTRELLLQCIKSVYDTTRNVTFEVHVVDNGSSDDSADTVASKFPHVNLIRNKSNLGFARANNIAIKQCSGRFICLINSDVLILPNCIDNLLFFIDHHAHVGIAAPRILNQDLSLQPNWQNFPTVCRIVLRAFAVDSFLPTFPLFWKRRIHRSKHYTCRNVDVLTGCFLLVRREAINQVGLIDETFFMYGEDLDWCKRFHKAGWDIVYYPRAEAIHYGGASSSKVPVQFFIEMYKSRLYYWEKHHGKLGKNCCWVIILFHHILRIILRCLLYTVYPSARTTTLPKIKRSMACIRWLVYK